MTVDTLRVVSNITKEEFLILLVIASLRRLPIKGTHMPTYVKFRPDQTGTSLMSALPLDHLRDYTA